MNDEMNERILRYMDKAEELSGKGVDFMSDQVPETIRQFLTYGLWSNVVVAVSLLAAIAGYVFISVKAYRIRQKPNGDWQKENLGPNSATLTVCGGFLCIPSLAIVVECCLEIIKISVAPNVYIIESLSNYL